MREAQVRAILERRGYSPDEIDERLDDLADEEIDRRRDDAMLSELEERTCPAS